MEQPLQVSQPPRERDTKKVILWIVAALLLAVATGIAVYFWQQNRINELDAKLKTAPTSTKPAKTKDKTQTPATTTPAKATLAETQLPYTFSYPADWTKVYDKPIHTNPQTKQTTYAITFMRPGTVIHEEPIGGKSTNKGLRVIVSAAPTSATTVEQAVGTPYGMGNRKDVQVAGQKAIEYTVQYEGETALYTAFIKDGALYNIVFTAEGGPLTSSYLSDYRALLASFTFK